MVEKMMSNKTKQTKNGSGPSKINNDIIVWELNVRPITIINSIYGNKSHIK